ncbi:TIGR00730 family Rossman fold protein [Desulfovibrio inopinatus]|uniref:LOG family protein n=1 Tax=Desulfovibrio inopinatus TaxID=102109 RepID=UPI000412B0F3|nr:TIGR00730 family Rossman fold protein [Desulfovibrio inopinatus]
MSLSAVCVFCGSNPGFDPAFMNAANELGRLLAEQHIQLVYGGAAVGLMGAVADAALAAGGEVHGVIPGFLHDKEIAHPGLTSCRVVDSMHERKAAMAEISDGFIALPGGMGTLEEICEVITWAQLGLHCKPCGFLNITDYYDPLQTFLSNMIENGFFKKAQAPLLIAETTPAALLQRFADYAPPCASKWIDLDKT